MPDFAPTVGTRELIAPIANPFVKPKTNSGFVIGVLRDGERFVQGFGRLSEESNVPGDESTLFEIGSISKVFTGNLLALLVRDHKVRFNDPVRKHLPDSFAMPGAGGDTITLLHLATHTSGLPRLPANLSPLFSKGFDSENPYAHYTLDDLKYFLGKHRLRRQPGAKYEYSNLGMGLLGNVLADRFGTDYETAVREQICKPLGLRDTTITLADDQKSRLAPGHTASGKPTPNWDLPTLAGAGALRSNVGDMLTYLEANLDPANVLYPVLAASTLPQADLGSLPPFFRRYTLSILASGLGLAIEAWAPVPPGSFLFLLTFILPVLLSAKQGGLGPGLLSLAAMLGGNLALWAERFGWLPATAAGLFIVVVTSQLLQPRGEVGLGWHRRRIGKSGVLCWHNGGTGGYRSFAGFIPESKIAVVVLANSTNSVDELAVQILEALQSDWQDRQVPVTPSPTPLAPVGDPEARQP